MVRAGLKLLLEEEGDFHVVGEAGDVEAALDAVRVYGPDVILLDLNMPGRPSLPAIPELLESHPGSAVVVMTQHDEPEFARMALSGGASGFVVTCSTVSCRMGRTCSSWFASSFTGWVTGLPLRQCRVSNDCRPPRPRLR